MSAGSDFIGPLLDEFDAIQEIGEGNNFASAPLTVSSVFKYGSATECSTGGLVGGNLLIASRVVIGQVCSLFDLGVFVKSPVLTQQVKLGIYSDLAGRPGSLIASTLARTAATGMMELPATASLASGTYWVAFVASQGIRLGAAANAGVARRMIPQPFGSQLPTSWPAGDVATAGLDFNWYAKVRVP